MDGTPALDEKLPLAKVRSDDRLGVPRWPGDRHRRPHVVIVGAGFGGLAAAHALRKASVDVTLIDKRNYHLFQPLLYQVATAGLSPSQIASPIRGILSRQRNATVLMGKVTGVDTAGKAVLLGGQRVSYDYLIVASGARHAYFGRDDWEPYAPGLMKVEDDTDIRRRVLVAFERAENETDPAERERLLNFVVIGGGPTGVEMSGAIAELAKRALAADFRNIDPRCARILLVEAGPRVLPACPEKLSEIARRSLEELGVEVGLGMPVSECDDRGVLVGTERVESRTVIWAAGVAASAAAKQMGSYAAKSIRARISGRAAPPPFRYRHAGNLATIGRKSAVVDFGWIKFSGPLAWLLWGAAHVYFLIGFRNRLAVMIDWLWAYVSYNRGSRLITGSDMDT